ncbi:MAG: D-alanyl-D-alanine carboxypeptidase family protein [Pseudomonadota bacterium]
MHFFGRLTLVFLSFIVAFTTFAQTPIPAAPSINAKSYLVRDHNSGKIIAEKNAHDRVAPASITKLMTAYVTFKKLAEGSVTLDSMVPISKRAYDAEGSRMFVEINSQVSLEDLIQGMIVQSGNDASIAIAEFLGGTEEVFATLMNYHADALGMTNSQFMNSTGLPDEGHYSTAWDIATLSSAIINEFPDYYRWYSQKKFTWNSIPQSNRNTLLWTDETVDGLKTGYTKEAGYCLVSSALRGEMRIISVVLGTPTEKGRANASRSLLNYAFSFYRTHRLYERGAELGTAKVWKADNQSLPVGLENELYITIPKGQYESLEASMNLQEPLTAPLAANTPLGSVTIKLQDDVIAQVPLIALRDVPEGSVFRRLSDSVMLWFE